MRLSADPSSPFYRRALLMRVAVYLDGVRLTNVVEFSEEERWVRYVEIGDHGAPIKNPDGSACIIRRTGRVDAVVLPSASEAIRSSLPLFLDWAQGPDCAEET